jgi:hypothetical protein
MDVTVEPVTQYGLNLYNCHGKLIATALQVDGLLVLDGSMDRAPGSTEYINTDNNNSCLLALMMTGHASQHDAKKWMLWHRRLAHVGLKAVEILPRITDAPKKSRKFNCDSCIKCKLARKPFTPRTSHATEPLQLVHSDICSPLETAIGGGRYMMLFINDATRHSDDCILKNKSEALERFNEWKAPREKK